MVLGVFRGVAAVGLVCQTSAYSEGELDPFHKVAGNRAPPGRKVKELVAVASRRSGKGRMGAALAVHTATLIDSTAVLAPGERGVVGCVSPTRAQAGILLDYCKGYLEASPLFIGVPRLLYERYRDYFGRDSDDVLVVAGDSRTFNPTLSAEVVVAAAEADPEAALSEWQGGYCRIHS
jgi:hypothetical protein